MKKTLTAAWLVLFAFSSCFCQEAPPRPDIDELLTVLRLGQITAPCVQRNAGALPPLLAPMLRDSGMPSARSAQIQLQAMHRVEAELAWEKIKPGIARIYAEAFTPEETLALIVFYKSPAGQRLLDRQPLLEKKIQELADQKVMALLPSILAEVKAEAAKAQPSPPGK